jgi:hypothetical protein
VTLGVSDGLARDVIVCYSSTLQRLIVGIIVVWFGVFENDIPCVYQTWEIAETAEGDVDERVRGADPNLDPDFEIKSAGPRHGMKH